MSLAQRTVALALALLSSTASAQTATLESTLERGVSLRELGRDEAALEVFEGAWARWRSPRALAQVAMAEHALGRWVAADAHLREALASDDPWVRRNRAALEGVSAVVASHVASLEVTGEPAGAEVLVDGVAVGSLPLEAPVRHLVGEARVEVRAAGHRAESRVVSLEAGPPRRETFTLERDVIEGPPRAPVVVVATPRTRSSGSPLRTLRWVAAGASGLFLAGAGVTFALHESTVGRYNDRCLGTSYPLSRETAECQSDREAAPTLSALSVAGLAVGLGLGVTAAVLFVVAPSAPRESLAGVSCGAGPGQVGVSCGGSF